MARCEPRVRVAQVGVWRGWDPDVDGSFEDDDGLCEVLLVVVGGAEVVEREGHLGVRGPHAALQDAQRPLEELDGLGIIEYSSIETWRTTRVKKESTSSPEKTT